MAKTNSRDEDEYYDRRQKGPDETFCMSCGAIIKKEAEVCPKCGVKNKLKDGPVRQDDKPKGSIFWLIVWIIIFWPIAIIYYLSRRWN